MSPRTRRRPTQAPARPAAARPLPAVGPLPSWHPARIAAIAVAAACLVWIVTFQLYDTDFWQHLLVGRTMWQIGRIPTTQLWSWPSYGAPDVNYAWGFEWLLWPFWDQGGIWGLFAWRWLTTLLAFGLLLTAARRMGAEGLSGLVALILCALVYRQRSQVRPESLAAVLLAVLILLLETRRARALGRDAGEGPPSARRPRLDPVWGLVPVAWIWANVHITYYLGFLLVGVHLLDAHWTAWRDPARRGESLARAAGLWRASIAALGISFVNPYGWKTLWQPFEYVLSWRHERLFQIISELQPVNWSLNTTNGLAVLLVAWPVLLLWRARRMGLDRVELLLCAGFIAMALAKQRFLGPLAIVAAPYLARDLDAWVRTRRWPRWTQPAGARAALASVAAVAIAIPECTRPDPPGGVGILWKNYPVEACDFMAAHGVRGHGLNHLRIGGYMVWRFWPDPERLAFLDIHVAGTSEMRTLYANALIRVDGWRALDRRFRFDYVLLARPQAPGDRLLDFVDADTSFALVFVDDAAAVYVRRSGSMAPVAQRFAYRVLGAGKEKLTATVEASRSDSLLWARLADETRRQVAASPVTALGLSLLANLAMADGRYEEARGLLERAQAVDRDVPRVHERLGVIALATGRPLQALEAFKRERRADRSRAGLDLRIGMAYQQLGDLERARKHYLRELRRNPGDASARQLLESLGRPPGS